MFETIKFIIILIFLILFGVLFMFWTTNELDWVDKQIEDIESLKQKITKQREK